MAQGSAIDGAFAAQQAQTVVDAGEYFFAWRIALSHAFGTDDPSTREDLMPAPVRSRPHGVLTALGAACSLDASGGH